MSVPEENFYCPLTLEIMEDPVIGPDGHTYERKAIENWLKINNISPMTRQVMNSKTLVPNIALRNTIQAFLQNNKDAKTFKKEKLDSEITREIAIESHILPDNQLFISLKAKEDPKRKASAFVFVLDVSGSMTSEASTPNKTGETDGFSRLDLVKHSVRTCIEVLEPQDSICVITFSDDAKVKLGVTKMDENGKKKAVDVVEAIHTEGMTNIWDGLRVGLLQVQKITDPNVNISLVLLTDGEPNVNPPRGIVPTLESAIKSLKIKQSFNICTMGYGTNLDSELLADIAKTGGGTYGYIPDCSMVGTIFVNYLSNVLCTYLSNSYLTIECSDPDVKFDKIPVGPLQFEQAKEFIVNLPTFKEYSGLTIKMCVDDRVVGEDKIAITPGMTPNPLNHELATVVRTRIIKTVYEMMQAVVANNDYIKAYSTLKNMYEDIKKIKESAQSQDAIIQITNYILDWETNLVKENKGGQIELSFHDENNFNKWGKHFLRSIMNSYHHQQCNNFKDPGVSHFAGDLFKQIRQKADDAFCMLPAPKPTANVSSPPNYSYAASSTSTTSSSAAPKANKPARHRNVNMNAYYNNCGGCFSGDGLVEMSDGSFKLVKDLKKGDVVKSQDANGKSTDGTVKCVVMTKIPNGRYSMCEIQNLKITPWHPLIHNNEWVFPINLVAEVEQEIDYIYNVVLENGTSISINNLVLCTLGHGLNAEIVNHPYFGTKRIIDDLSAMKGWNSGLVELDKVIVMRTNENGMVSKLITQ